MKGRMLAVCLAAILLGGCATQGPIDHKAQVAGEGTPEERIARLEKAAAKDKKLRGELFRQKELAIAQMLADADQQRQGAEMEQALASYQRVLKIDGTNRRAREGVNAIELERRHREAITAAESLLKEGDTVAASRQIAAVLKENPNHREARAMARRIAEAQSATRETVLPQLNASLSKPITLEFRDASLSAVFELISRTAGVNFVFDRDVRPDTKVNIFVRNTSVEDVIKIILLTNQLERKVLNDNTVLIYPNTPAKAKDYQDLMVRSFYLGNSDPKQVLAMLKTLMRARDVYIDEKLNLLIIRDTPQAVRLAEKLVLAQDVAEPEVMLEVEVLEVGQGKLQELGIRFPDSIQYGDYGTGSAIPGTVRLTGTSFKAWVTNPALVANLRKQDTSTRVLANPRIRVKNREKAKIHVGEKVPVVTTTSTANVGISSSVSYIDVGLKLDVEPSVHLDDDISIKINLEVSNILEQIPVKDVFAFRLGTRNATTTLRLRDGETQILAGLINDEDRRTANKVPGLGDLPILGRLFSNHNDSQSKTEVVLLMTPRVVRNIIRPEAIDAEIYSGTDSVAGMEPLRLKPTAPGALSVAPATSGSATPAGARPPAPAAVQPVPAPTVASQPISIAAPASVKPGEEFSVRINVPMAVTQGQMQLAFDWKAFTFLSASAAVQAVPGLVAILIDSDAAAPFSAEIKFKVSDKPPEPQSQFVLDGAQFFGADGQLIQGQAPGPTLIKITKPN
ncbi:MAG: secretin N-terminal domain-containing protein [Burkholderiales bacterium]